MAFGPYVPQLYDNRQSTADIARTMLEASRQRFIARQQQAQMLQQGITGVGQAVGDALQAKRAADEQKQVGEAVSESLANPDANMGETLSNYKPELRQRILKGVSDANAAASLVDERKARIRQLKTEQEQHEQALQQDTANYAGTLAYHTLKAINDHPEAQADGGLGAFSTAVTLAKQHKMPGAEQFDAQIEQGKAALAAAQASGDPAQVKAVQDHIRQQASTILGQFQAGMDEKTRKQLLDEENAQHEYKVENGKVIKIDKGAGTAGVIADVGPKVNPGTREAYIVGKYGQNATPEQVLQGTKEYEAATVKPMSPEAQQAHADAMAARGDAALQRSHEASTKRLDAHRAPLQDQNDKIEQAMTTLQARTPEGDAVAARQVLAALNQGKGGRLDKASMDRIYGAKTYTQGLMLKLNGFMTGSPLTLTDKERAEMGDLLSSQRTRNAAKLAKVNAAQDEIDNATDITSHNKTVTKLRKDLEDVGSVQQMSDQDLINTFLKKK